ncbi:uncharacterized protein EV420DRAFT_438566 [Desarmillaria tabescens]|uniref:Uncharacterized protein n=1 Tax=Armillaria tabescens TaxID=1929756 RepID=A0AA39NLS7_ARMTA|nr:uncharacterized protein EV420DRAFT_438566 [Desarmillaria tabescens]KAK0467987.1 hypothetical protein EV420DRAFT_438566 [Desarmillaria tabescens]
MSRLRQLMVCIGSKFQPRSCRLPPNCSACLMRCFCGGIVVFVTSGLQWVDRNRCKTDDDACSVVRSLHELPFVTICKDRILVTEERLVGYKLMRLPAASAHISRYRNTCLSVCSVRNLDTYGRYQSFAATASRTKVISGSEGEPFFCSHIISCSVITTSNPRFSAFGGPLPYCRSICGLGVLLAKCLKRHLRSYV